MTTIWGPGPTEYRFFWAWEVARFGSEEEAKKFIQDDPAVMTPIGRLLDRPGANFGSDGAVVDAMVNLVTGGFVTADLANSGSFAPMWRCHELFRDGQLALDFLSRVQRDPITVTRLKSVMGEINLGPSLSVATVDQVFTAVNDAMVDTMARLLASGRFVASRVTTVSFEPMWRYHELFRERHFALNLLSRFQLDPIALASLKGILAEHNRGRNLSKLSVHQVFVAIADLLATERLISGFRVLASGGSYEEVKMAPRTTTSRPAAKRVRKGAEEEAPTLPDNDGAAQAAALRAAAATGEPFCEECARSAAAAAAAQAWQGAEDTEESQDAAPAAEEAAADDAGAPGDTADVEDTLANDEPQASIDPDESD